METPEAWSGWPLEGGGAFKRSRPPEPEVFEDEVEIVQSRWPIIFLLSFLALAGGLGAFYAMK